MLITVMVCVLFAGAGSDLVEMAAWIPDEPIAGMTFYDFEQFDDAMRERNNYENLAKFGHSAPAFIPRMIFEGADALLEVRPFRMEFVPQKDVPTLDLDKRTVTGVGYRDVYGRTLKRGETSYVARTRDLSWFIISCGDAVGLFRRAVTAGIAAETGEKIRGMKTYTWNTVGTDFGRAEIMAVVTRSGFILVAPDREQLARMVEAGVSGIGLDTDAPAFRSLIEFLPDMPGYVTWTDVRLPVERLAEFQQGAGDPMAERQMQLQLENPLRYRLRSVFSGVLDGEDVTVNIVIQVFENTTDAEKFAENYRRDRLDTAHHMTGGEAALRMTQDRLDRTSVEQRGNAVIEKEALTAKGKALYEEFEKALAGIRKQKAEADKKKQ